jgi:hypothetical protein
MNLSVDEFSRKFHPSLASILPQAISKSLADREGSLVTESIVRSSGDVGVEQRKRHGVKGVE